MKTARGNVPDSRSAAREPMNEKSRLEAEISQAIVRFEKEYMGRGPTEIRTYLLGDLVLVRLKGVLTPSELKLAETGGPNRRRYLIKRVRQELIEHGRPLLDTLIQDILGIPVVSLHTDISVKTGERIIVFSLERTVKIEFER